MWIDQTLFGEKGNCFQACVASVLRLPLELVPHFCLSKEWLFDLQDWLMDFRLYWLEVKFDPTLYYPPCYAIVSGKGPRGVHHAVVGEVQNMGDERKLVVVHDPHPSREGLLGDPEDWTLGYFLSLAPERSVDVDDMDLVIKEEA